MVAVEMTDEVAGAMRYALTGYVRDQARVVVAETSDALANGDGIALIDAAWKTREMAQIMNLLEEIELNERTAS